LQSAGCLWFDQPSGERNGGERSSAPGARLIKRAAGTAWQRIMSRILDVPQSGKIGTLVSVNTRFGQIRRQYVVPKDPKTPAQMKIRSNLGRVAARWRTLTDEQRSAWTAAGRDAETRRRLGKRAFLTGCQFYIKINCARAAIGLDLLTIPPDPPTFAKNQVEELTITNSHGNIALKLSVPSTPAENTLVLGAAPCSAGRSSAQHFYFLGFLPDPVRGESDITSLYVAKYGAPPPGSRIFIRTQQHIDGWDDLPKQTTAVVPRA
jgi:hypothetical protein